jgi:hypothetical protein
MTQHWKYVAPKTFGDDNSSGGKSMRLVVRIVAVVIGLIIVAAILFSVFGFVAHKVNPNEIGVIQHRGKVVEVVGPGIYTKFGIFWDIEDIKIEGLTACARDPEVLTQDQQRIGVKTCATVHRPGVGIPFDDFVRIYGQFKTLLIDDDALAGIEDANGERNIGGKMQEIAAQAMKSCVGDRRFEEAAVGASRDELLACLFERENALGEGYGLSFKNVTVPNIEIHPTVQEKLDLITEEKFDTDVQRQQELRIRAEADKELARQQGEIRVSQGTAQENQRQRAITADLERQAIESELSVIEAQKANDLRTAELDLLVAEKELEIETVLALAQLAPEQALAELYAGNASYVEYLVSLAFARAWSQTDKVIVPVGTVPDAVISPSGEVDIVVEPGG